MVRVNLLAAVEVPINIHYKGSWLVHEVNDCAARLAIVHEQYIERFVEVADQLEHLTDLVVVCGDAPGNNQRGKSGACMPGASSKKQRPWRSP